MSDITNSALQGQGKKRIEWAAHDMPVLMAIRERFTKEQPFVGKKIAACLHVTAETANLVRTLKAGGADVRLAASNPLSTQDDVAAALSEVYGIPTFARKGEDRDTFFAHLKQIVSDGVHITMDDGADLMHLLHTERTDLLMNMLGGTEETTTGVIRLRAMADAGELKVPVVAVNDAKTKNLFDNRYGTGQSTLDSIIRSTDILIAGKVIVVAGYGWCGKGIARRAHGMGANVIVTEIDPVKALEAVMDGYRVMPMQRAAPYGDVFCTVTGNINVIIKDHIIAMKDGAMLCNAGHFDVEITVPELRSMATQVTKDVRPFVDEYLVGGKRIYLLAEGRLVNLAAAEGHPASVMDMSFSTQALACAWVASQSHLIARVYDVPESIENDVATAKLASMGVTIDTLTPEQERYLKSWQEGT